MALRRIFFVLSLALAASWFAPSNAEAQTIYGLWRSTSGNTFEIPFSRGNRFDIVLTRPNGQRVVLPGAWVRGMRGIQFNYMYGRSRYIGTFSARRSNLVRVLAPNGKVSWWKRSSSRRSRGIAWAGRWRSTSGNIFTVPHSRGPFNIIVTYRNGRKGVLRAYWVRGLVGIQFRYGRPANTVTYNPRRPGRLRVVDARGRIFWWIRVD
ncbi:MAG: hypothetical protein H6727_04535 [Myxococcales bacterium]|nr:hypothetical protein [Myxococcales bacterium]